MAKRFGSSSGASGGAAVFTPDASMRILVLHGKERFLIDEYTRLLAKALEEAHGGIEQFEYDGESVAPAVVLDELRSYGLMQTHKLVIVDNADALLAEKKDGEEEAAAPPPTGGGGTSKRKLFERYAERPVDSATLVLQAETWRPGNFDKLVAKVGAVHHCELLKDDKAVGWCIDRCRKRHGVAIAQAAAAQLVELVGADLTRIDSELLKLSAYVGDGGTITTEVVSSLVGLSRSQQAWVIQEAVLSGHAETALQKLTDLLTVSNQAKEVIMWSLSDLARKLHAGARLIADGVPASQVTSSQRIFGNAFGPFQRAVAGRSARAYAQLLRACTQTDHRNKSGWGDPVRNIELLTVQFADAIGSATAA